MNMQINIKSSEARELADQITKRTGETITEAVTAALKERLKRLTVEERLARVDELTKSISGRLAEPWKSKDHAGLLYDELGLPQ
jgi:antitoxin VapB